MDKSDRPQGRKKRVGSGGGGVFKRGEGVGGQTGGPVGDAGGYSERTEDTAGARPQKPAKGGGKQPQPKREREPQPGQEQQAAT